MTPAPLARQLVSELPLGVDATVLEPSFGDGSFLIPLIERLMALRTGTSRDRFTAVMTENLYGVEIDPIMYQRAIDRIEDTYGPLPGNHHLLCDDYFRVSPLLFGGFALIVGNPPFGGTFDPLIEDDLDKRYGNYGGHKLKKETYSFFVAKAISELRLGGHLQFICSDTFLTIKTMRGLRELLADTGAVSIADIPEAFSTTKQPMVVLSLCSSGPSATVRVRSQELPRELIETTPNFSWGLDLELAPLFAGGLLGDYLVCTGGMTIGRNELFVRRIEADGAIVEPFDFEYFERPITVKGERERARLHRLSLQQTTRIERQESEGVSRRAVRAVERATPQRIMLPHPDYLPYNKASPRRIFAPPSHVVYWRDDGDAVLTFKRDGPWYLHGVGGAPYFLREGLTWQLVAPKINARYLPSGYILDSGAPCGFLRPAVDDEELYIILAWLQTELATSVLKRVINHTRNIQGKDVERLPYPHWVAPQVRRQAGNLVRDEIKRCQSGERANDSLAAMLNDMFLPPIELSVAA